MDKPAKVMDFKDLIVWQRAKDLSIEIYKLTRSFPRDEQFGLVSQLRRAGVSIVSNIAEGFVRNSTKEFIRFLYTALASCAEIEAQFIIASELNYVDKGKYICITDELKIIQKMLNRFIYSLKNKI
ncbi:MAG: four helix bundle protein [bacterium]